MIERLAHVLRTPFPETKGSSHANLKYMRAVAGAWPDSENVQQAIGRLPRGTSWRYWPGWRRPRSG